MVVVGPSMVKFIAGPLAAAAAGLGYLEAVLCTALGMMSTVVLLTYVGSTARVWLIGLFSRKNEKPKKFSKRNRQIVRIWSKYGLKGVAFLTPLLLTPPGGTLIAVYFGEPKAKIVLYMLISAIIWSFIITGGVYLIGDKVVKAYLPGT